jgi:thiol-disulfide isomerase/thioredoxin
MKRRTAAIAGVAVAAGAAGAGAALWRLLSVRTELPPDFWSLRFEQPGGGELVLATLRGQPLLLNFWATWCPPCVTEMPMLDAFQRAQRGPGWQVVGLAVDSPTPVRQFLAQYPVDFAIGLAGLNGIDLARSLGNPDGGLPFTVVVDRSGRARERKLGALAPKDLDAWVAMVGNAS